MVLRIFFTQTLLLLLVGAQKYFLPLCAGYHSYATAYMTSLPTVESTSYVLIFLIFLVPVQV